jgi:hypothetical protein
MYHHLYSAGDVHRLGHFTVTQCPQCHKSILARRIAIAADSESESDDSDDDWDD